MSGVSLGGLASAFVGYAFDSTFGKVGCFSLAYWWDLDSLYRFAQARGRPRGLGRFYQDTGTNDNFIGTMEEIALAQGFVPGLDFMSYTVIGGSHVAGAWETLPGDAEIPVLGASLSRRAAALTPPRPGSYSPRLPFVRKWRNWQTH